MPAYNPNDKKINQWRHDVDARLEEITIHSAKHSSDLHHIKDVVDEIKIMVKEQNGRVRKNENMISKMQGVGAVLGIVYAGFIGWLFKN